MTRAAAPQLRAALAARGYTLLAWEYRGGIWDCLYLPRLLATPTRPWWRWRPGYLRASSAASLVAQAEALPDLTTPRAVVALVRGGLAVNWSDLAARYGPQDARYLHDAAPRYRCQRCDDSVTQVLTGDWRDAHSGRAFTRLCHFCAGQCRLTPPTGRAYGRVRRPRTAPADQMEMLP